jgi:integrase/recombinase XerD
LANKGVGVRLLAALAGHSHISTTQRYIDVNADQMRDAVELL